MKSSSRNILWNFSPRIVDRYIAREFLFSYMVAILVILSLRILIDLFVQFDEFIESQPGGSAPGALTVIGYIVDYYGPKTLEYFRDFSGTIILLAAAFSLARLSRQNELVAILASGVSLKRVIAPIVILGFALNLVMSFDQEVILPPLADRLARSSDEMAALHTISVELLPDGGSDLKNQPLPDQSLFRARKYDPENKTIDDLLVILRRQGQMIGRVTADKAAWDKDQKLWRLENGWQITTDSFTNVEKSVPLAVYRSSFSADYLWLQRNSDYKTLMSSAELSRLLRRGMKPAEYNEIITEKHFRVTDPIINMVMLLLSLPLLVSRERRSTKTALLLALLGAGGCFLATFTCKLLAGGVLDPFLTASLPVIIFFPLSILGFDSIKT